MSAGQRLDTISIHSCLAHGSPTHGLRGDDPCRKWWIWAASLSFSLILTSPIPTPRGHDLVLE